MFLRQIIDPSLAQHVAALNQRMGRGGSVILDLRADADAFLKQHVKGALFTPLRGGQLPIAAGSYVKEDERILLLLEHEGQLDEAVRQLTRIGLDRVEAWLPVAEAMKAGATGSLPRIHATKLPKGVCGLDVRYADEHADERLRGARHIAHTRLAERLADVPTDCALYVHCASGERAAIASAFLAREGREVVVVQGGLDDVPETRKT
jgi:hydroxyacylglutathione hydrolase